MTAQRRNDSPRGRQNPSSSGHSNGSNVREWVGRDISRDFRPRRLRFRISLPLVFIGLAVGLALVVLRIDLLRTRYALSEATAKERELHEEQRRITVEMRKVRAPSQLIQMAREEGFVQPERIIELEPLEADDRGEALP